MAYNKRMNEQTNKHVIHTQTISQLVDKNTMICIKVKRGNRSPETSIIVNVMKLYFNTIAPSVRYVMEAPTREVVYDNNNPSTLNVHHSFPIK